MDVRRVVAVALGSCLACAPGVEPPTDSAEATEGGETGDGGEPGDPGCIYPIEWFETAVYAGNIATDPSGFAAYCDPRHPLATTADLQCCSSDPAAAASVPLFSSANNSLGRFGQCVPTRVMAGLPNGCPIPCDPTWPQAMREATCGPDSSALCCGERDTLMEDCVYDVASSCYRPGEQGDVGPAPADCPTDQLAQSLEAAGLPTELARCSVEAFAEFGSAQDPDENACTTLASGSVPFDECLAARGLNHHRGFCLARSPDVMNCPLTLSDAEKIALGMPLDGCAQLNEAVGATCG